MRRTLFLLGLVGMLCLAPGQGRTADFDFAEHEAVMDSLREMPRWEQVRWLAERGLPDPYLRFVPLGDSGPIRSVGRWSYGPATSVTVRATATDTIVFLSRGSGVSVVRFRSQGGLSLDLLADINCATLTGRVTVQDSLLYVGSGGLETYDISDLTRPVRLSRSSFVAYDYAINDTFLYTVSRDSFRIYSIADPHGLRYLGGCRDSAYVMYVSGNHAYLGHQYGLYILDVSNPASPHRVSTIGHDVLSVAGRDTLLFIGTYDQGLRVYNVRNPAGPVPVGTLADIQTGDIHLPPTCDTVLYTPTFDVISIRDPRNPTSIGHVDTPGWGYGITAVPALNYALVADYFKGLTAVNIVLPKVPFIDTSRFGADLALDIQVDGTVAYVANERAGLQLLDVSMAAKPRWIAGLDTVAPGARSCRSVVARDSFVFLDWWVVHNLLSVDVSEPAQPKAIGGCEIFNSAEAMVLRDSLLYVAQNHRFQVVNVARPREPRVVGEVRLPDRSYELVLKDSLAYIANGLGGLILVNVADPETLTTISNLTFPNPAIGVAVKDSFAYVGAKHLRIVNVARPDSPSVVDTVPLSIYGGAIEIDDTLLYVGTRVGYSGDLRLFSIADPVRPQQVGFYQTPLSVNRVVVEEPYIYLSCSDAGVVILEVIPTGITEPDRHGDGFRPRVLRAAPNPTRGVVHVNLPPGQGPANQIQVYNSAGRRVLACAGKEVKSRIEVDLGELPPGLYFLELKAATETHRGKIVVQKE